MLQGFEDMVHEGVQCLLVSTPVKTVPILAGLLLDPESVSLGTRLLVIEELIEASYQLAKMDAPAPYSRKSKARNWPTVATQPSTELLGECWTVEGIRDASAPCLVSALMCELGISHRMPRFSY